MWMGGLRGRKYKRLVLEVDIMGNFSFKYSIRTF
jgi:hypothetical protein